MQHWVTLARRSGILQGCSQACCSSMGCTSRAHGTSSRTCCQCKWQCWAHLDRSSSRRGRPSSDGCCCCFVEGGCPRVWCQARPQRYCIFICNGPDQCRGSWEICKGPLCCAVHPSHWLLDWCLVFLLSGYPGSKVNVYSSRWLITVFHHACSGPPALTMTPHHDGPSPESLPLVPGHWGGSIMRKEVEDLLG